MKRRNSMCYECPFRLKIEKEELEEIASMDKEHWACHIEETECGVDDIQCRGHWEAQRKYKK